MLHPMDLLDLLDLLDPLLVMCQMAMGQGLGIHLWGRRLVSTPTRRERQPEVLVPLKAMGRDLGILNLTWTRVGLPGVSVSVKEQQALRPRRLLRRRVVVAR